MQQGELEEAIYLKMTECVYLCPTKTNSTSIVNTTVVLLKVVYIGTFTPRTASMVTS